ncbi:MAG: helix-turn-helix transcriptional regulator [Candidatus Onthomonas sp.]|nr:helix-turn-helix transcriptional regulator [Candidatus Onthomonas sp.]
MILADKITMLRKRSGWSQEELAERLGVSRQAVSKWESGTSLPDLDRIIKMSELFCVSTDYLLKDEVQEITLPEGDGAAESSGGYDLSLEEANAFLELTRRLSSRMAAAIALLVLSPVCLIQLGAVAEFRKTSLTEGMAAGIGLSVLLVLVAIGVGLLIFDGMKLSRYRHLEEEELTLQYGVKGLAERRRQADESGYRASVVAGVVLCILGVIPLLLAGTMELGDYITTSCVSLLLVLVAAAVFLFVRFGNIWSSYKKILQEEEYTWEQKRTNRKLAWFPGVYWLVVTAVYLAFSFSTGRWNFTWIVWPVAGVLFAALYGILQALVKRKSETE